MTDGARRLRRLAQRVWAECLARSGALWWVKRRLRSQGAVVVLAFHRVLNEQDGRQSSSLPGMVVRSETFAAVLKHIARHHLPVDAAEAEPGGKPGRIRIALTFDDGWADNAGLVKLLSECSCPAVVFVCPSLCGQILPFAADPPGAADRSLSWEEIRRMRRAGIRFGAHTRSHAALPELRAEEARAEIAGSKADLERALGEPCTVFAFPYGRTSPALRRQVREAGFARAFALRRGVWTEESDPWDLPRVCVWERSFTGLTGRFSPVMFDYCVFWRAWRASARHRAAREAEPSHVSAGKAA